MSDLISREEVLRAIITAGVVEPDLGYAHLYKVIENLPSAKASQNLAEPNKTMKGSDLISRADAIDAVWKIVPVETEIDSTLLDKAEVIVELSVLPSAEAVQGWIPCSERLPNTNGIYIVTRRRSDGFECRNLTDACYFDGTSTWHDDTRVNHERKYLTDVLAWMPLPEPYRKDGEA